ncbi:MAG: Cof-type HAD-IIB family hydrolase [Pyrinomonadaceae bacterium]
MIKLLALDLDGTLLNSKGKISEINKQAIRRAEEKGVLVTIATGRRFRDALPVALEAEFNAPVITHNGALLKFAQTLETVAFSTIKTGTVSEILRVGDELGGDALLSADPHGKGTLFYDTISEKNIPLQKYIAWSKTFHGAEAEEAVHHVENLEDIIESVETVHVSFSGTCEPMSEMQKILEGELKNSVNILATVYTHLDFTLLDILPPGASKAHGITELSKLHKFLPENIMVIGDNFNDLEMLDYAGTPVVMGNASPELLEREEFFTTLSNDENGVALAIERFILSHE